MTQAEPSPDANVYRPEQVGDDASWDAALRPKAFHEFIGQDRIRENLKIYIEAASRRGEVLDHILFSGLPGLGKTTLASIVARAMGAGFKSTSGPALEKPGDLAGILTSLEEGDVLFIDEIHRLGKVVEEFLYPAMEDYAVDIVLDSGPHARTLRLDIKPFTLIGATTREGLLSAPFRARFGVLERLEPYPPADIHTILRRSAGLLEIEADEDALGMLASRSRGTPRVANRFLRRIRDLAQVRSGNHIDTAVAGEGLGMLGIDGAGLESMDRRILECVVGLGGGAVGIKTIAATVGEEEETIELVYEPYLIREGYLVKTPRGRRATDKAYAHLGRSVPAGRGADEGPLADPRSASRSLGGLFDET